MDNEKEYDFNNQAKSGRIFAGRGSLKYAPLMIHRTNKNDKYFDPKVDQCQNSN